MHPLTHRQGGVDAPVHTPPQPIRLVRAVVSYALVVLYVTLFQVPEGRRRYLLCCEESPRVGVISSLSCDQTPCMPPTGFWPRRTRARRTTMVRCTLAHCVMCPWGFGWCKTCLDDDYQAASLCTIATAAIRSTTTRAARATCCPTLHSLSLFAGFNIHVATTTTY